MAADIARGSLYMAAADKGAAVIEDILNSEIVPIIDQVLADGAITNAKAIHLKKRIAAVGAKVVSEVLGLHSDLIDAAEDAGIDLPAPSDGTTELKAAIDGMVSPLGGGR